MNVKKFTYVLLKSRRKYVSESTTPIISIDNIQLRRATRVKYFGVNIDENLSWKAMLSM